MKRIIWGVLALVWVISPASAGEKLACGAELAGFLDACGTPKARFKSCACRDEKLCHEQALIDAESAALAAESAAREPYMACQGKELKETYEGKRLPGAKSGCDALEAAKKAAQASAEAASAAKLAYGRGLNHYKECQ